MVDGENALRPIGATFAAHLVVKKASQQGLAAVTLCHYFCGLLIGSAVASEDATR